jgi:small subunit ribosomal protein S8
MYTDPISDFLTRIRNAQSAHLETIEMPGSRIKFTIAKILEREGYIQSAGERVDDGKKTLSMTLKYDGKEAKIRKINRVSTPGRRVYRGAGELPRVLSDIGIAIISTSAGIMTNKDARRRKLGGEVLCEIY